MPYRSITTALLVLALLPLVASAADAEKPVENRFESSIQAFEKADKADMPEPGGVLFLGSSSIRMWDLEKWFPKAGYLNRGFGGSEISDSIHFFDRVVTPYRPRIILFYAGDNDVAKGKSGEKVAEDFETFAGMVHEKFPKTEIAYIAIKPSIARWNLVETMRDANARIAKLAEKDERITFVDIDTPMIGEDGRPRADLFLKDGLHMNDAGYAIWVDIVRPLVEKK